MYTRNNITTQKVEQQREQHETGLLLKVLKEESLLQLVAFMTSGKEKLETLSIDNKNGGWVQTGSNFEG